VSTDRKRLLRRIDTSGARIIALIAPPGYGRTALADCVAARGAFRAMHDFRVEPQGLGEVLINLEHDLPAGAEGGATVILDNLDCLEREGDDLSLLAAFVAVAPESAHFVLCALTVPAFLRQLPPNEVLILGADDLKFSDEECAEVFAGVGGARAVIPAVQSLTRGWPAAVLMLLRYAREHDIEHALARSSELIDALTAYLVANVFSIVDAAGLEDLLMIAAVPNARLADLSASDVDRLPFVTVAGETLEMHPLVRAVIVRRYASRCAVILADATERAKLEGDWERAAACAIEAGDSAGAAAALDAMGAFLSAEPSKMYRSLFRRIDPLYLTAYPYLWASTIRARRFITSPTTLLFEAKTVWSSVTPQTPPLLRIAVACAYAQLLADAGRDTEALALLKDVEAFPADETATAAMPIVHLTSARILTASGRFSEGEQRRIEALRNAGSSLVTQWFLVLYEMPLARSRGDAEAERNLAERAVAIGQRSDEPMMLLYALAEASFGAWLTGDDEAHAQSLTRLRAALAIQENATFRAFADAVSGLRSKAPPQLPVWRARADLVRCACSADIETAALAARDALNASREASNRFLIVLSAIAVAMLTPSLRTPMLAEAKAAAAEIESRPLADAVAAFERDDADLGMLAPFVGRLRMLTTQNADALTLHFFRGAIGWCGAIQQISHLGRALIFALGTAPQRTREELYEMLWPSLNEKAAATALRMSVYRVRNQLSEGAVIVATPDGYALDGSAIRDMPLLEAALQRVHSDQLLDKLLRDKLAAALADIQSGRPVSLTAYEWWTPIEAGIEHLGETIAMRLARDAMQRGAFDEALSVGTQLLSHDPCSETGCEILVRTNLARGDRSGAESNVRTYERSLKAELDVESAPRLRTLLVSE
jgi:DNA-binding SARP family transcriptional activator